MTSRLKRALKSRRPKVIPLGEFVTLTKSNSPYEPTFIAPNALIKAMKRLAKPRGQS